MSKVTQKGLEKILKGGVDKLHYLGEKLYINISGNSRIFFFRYTKDKRIRKYSLYGYHPETNTLANARKRVTEFNAMLAQGLDPHQQKQLKIDVAAKEEASRLDAGLIRDNTFEKVAYECIAHRTPQWTNPKSPQTWTNTLKTYAFPVIGHLPVSEIDRDQIVDILRPIWHTKYPTAKKVRQRIEAIFSYAIYYKLRSSNNPANYKDNLEIPLPPVDWIVTSHAALNYKELPEFMRELRKRDGLGARALEFLILNANRTTEVRKARWNEFDLEKRQWLIPVEVGRLGKTKKPHKVPLSTQSVEILLTLKKYQISDYVFPNTRSTNHLSDAGMDSVIKRMRKDKNWADDFGKKITVHGFRSTMRDYISEQTDIDRDVGETILAHTVGTAVERAYRRGDLLDKRRFAMQHWSDYAYGKPSAKVVQLRA